MLKHHFLWDGGSKSKAVFNIFVPHATFDLSKLLQNYFCATCYLWVPAGAGAAGHRDHEKAAWNSCAFVTDGCRFRNTEYYLLLRQKNNTFFLQLSKNLQVSACTKYILFTQLTADTA